jgi:hypothetical protein
MKTKYYVTMEYPLAHFFGNKPDNFIDKCLREAKLPEIDGSGAGFGVRDCTVHDLKTKKDANKVVSIAKKAFKKFKIEDYTVLIETEEP